MSNEFHEEGQHIELPPEHPTIGKPPLDNPLERTREDPEGEWMKSHGDESDSISVYINENPSNDLLGRQTTNRHEFLTVKDNSPDADLPIIGTHDESTLYTVTSIVNNPSSSQAINEVVVRFGNVRLPRMDGKANSKSSGLHTGSVGIVDVTLKNDFVEACFGLSFLGFGLEQGEDSSITISLGLMSTKFTGETVNAVTDIDSTLLGIKLSIQEIEQDIEQSIQDVRKDIEDKFQEIENEWDALNTPEGAEWFFEQLTRS